MKCLKFTTLVLALCLSLSTQAIVNVAHPDASALEGAVRDAIVEGRRLFEESEKNATDYGQLGAVYHAHEFEAAAGQAYRNAFELSPADARWAHLAGIISHSRGQFDDAIRFFEDATRLNPQYLPSRIRLAEACIEAAQLDRAQQVLLPLINDNSSMAIVYSSYGKTLSLKGEHSAALEQYQRALELQPKATQLHYHIAQSWRQLGDREKATAALTLQGNRPVYYQDPIHDRVRSTSRSSAYYMSLAEKAAQARDYQIALQLLQKAARFDPENLRILVHQARMIDALEFNDEAIRMLDEVLTKDPGHAGALLERGSIEEIAERDTSASDFYRRAVRSQPELFAGHQFLANSLMRQLQFGEAAEHYRLALDLKPERTELVYRRAAAEYESGDCVQSTATLLNLVSELQTDFEALMMYARVVATCNAVHAEHLGNALNAARNMYRLQPELPVITTLAMVEAAAGNFEEAYSYQAQAIFQAVKNSQKEEQDKLRHDLSLYEQNRIPDRPWSSVHKVLFPRHMTRADKY